MYTPLVLTGNNLSIVWSQLLLESLKPKVSFVSPLEVQLKIPADFACFEDAFIRTQLDKHLVSISAGSVRTVANTIFPERLWNKCTSRVELYHRYFAMWPRIRKYNRLGTYFYRLVCFGPKQTNQLEYLITYWTGGTRRHSGLQASLFDPACDQVKTRRRGFPCLSHISLIPRGANGKDGLELVAFYPTQTILERAYGNYLGLCYLGRFLAGQMSLSFVRLTCHVNEALLGSTKGQLKGLESKIEPRVP